MILTKDSINKRFKTRSGDIAVITDYCESCLIYGHAGYIERDDVRYLGEGKWEKYTRKEGNNWTRQGRSSQFGGKLSKDLVAIDCSPFRIPTNSQDCTVV